jgi:hypothetical protein
VPTLQTGAPRQHTPTFGDFDFDTYLREDLPAAAAHIAARTGSRRMAGVGHSMGGMLLACLAAGANSYSYEEPGEEAAKKKADEGEEEGETEKGKQRREKKEKEEEAPGAEWEMSRVVTIASCLECSSRSGPGVPESSYARLAALAGAVPDYLYGGRGLGARGCVGAEPRPGPVENVIRRFLVNLFSYFVSSFFLSAPLYAGRAKSGPAVPQIPLGPLSIGQAIAIESVLGAPPPARGVSQKKDRERRDASNDGVGDDGDDGGDSGDKGGTEFWKTSAVSLSTCYPGATEPALIRQLLLKGFGNVPLRLVLQMATLFAPGGLATREETVARRERAAAEAGEGKRKKDKARRRLERKRRRQAQAKTTTSTSGGGGNGSDSSSNTGGGGGGGGGGDPGSDTTSAAVEAALKAEMAVGLYTLNAVDP